MISVRNSGVLPVEVPERGELLIPIAGLGRRLAAALIDLVVLAGAGLVVVALTLALLPSPALAGPISFAVLALVPVGGPLLFELLWRGQSPGKRLLDLRVVSRDGAPASRGQLLMRNVLRLVDFLPFGYFLGLASMLLTAHGQRLGDLVGGTVVAREDPLALAEVLPEPEPSAVPRELRGVPPAVLASARRLLHPGPHFDAGALAMREAQVVIAIRRHCPELAAETDAGIWRRVRAMVEDSP